MITPEELLPKWVQNMTSYSRDGIKELMIKYAKLAIEEQIKICAESAEVDYRYNGEPEKYKGSIAPPEPYVKGILDCKRVIE